MSFFLIYSYKIKVEYQPIYLNNNRVFLHYDGEYLKMVEEGNISAKYFQIGKNWNLEENKKRLKDYVIRNDEWNQVFKDATKHYIVRRK